MKICINWAPKNFKFMPSKGADTVREPVLSEFALCYQHCSSKHHSPGEGRPQEAWGGHQGQEEKTGLDKMPLARLHPKMD